MYIYLIDYNYNNWYYIGKTSSSIEERFNSHKCACRKNKTKNHKVWNKSANEGNQPEIILLEETNNETELNKLEKWYIAYFKSIGVKLTNLTDGGDGLSGHIFSTEHKNKISENRKGKYTITQEHINILKMANTRPRSEEFKARRKEIRTGAKWSEEVKKKISESNKGKHHVSKRQKHVNQIDIKTGDIIHTFNSVNEAALYINPNKFKSIRSSIECAANPNGKQKTAGGFKWEYKN
jgi:hypothetical protein